MEKCLICGRKTQSFTHPKTHMVFHKCSFCEAIFKDSGTHPNKEDEEKRYLEHNNELTNQGYVNFLQKFIDLAIKPYLSQGHLLDFGSGPKPVLKWLLEKQGYHVDCYDPFFSKDMPLDDDLYDMITATEVMEHVHYPKEVLTWIDQHTKPGGFISFMTLFYPKDQETFFKWFYIRDYTHVVFYTTKTFEVIAEMMQWHLLKHDDYRVVVFQKRS